jgi:calcineurin-like phosphoesterase family protein
MNGTKYKVFFVSDLHFNHASILYFHPERRKYAGITLEELQNNKYEAIRKHDEWLIKLWNSTIGKKDFVYILGEIIKSNPEKKETIINTDNGGKMLLIGIKNVGCVALQITFRHITLEAFPNFLY